MLVDSTVLITGASSGIGRACAEAFAAAGARLVLMARREERLRALADQLDTEVVTEVVDVRDRAAVEAALDRAVDSAPWAGEVDVLVNNAGLGVGKDPLPDGDPEEWDRMLDTNVRGLLNVTRPVVRRMRERGRGDVINIGSIAGHEVYPGGAVYCASKAAVDRITKGLRMDLLGSGVRVATIDPGMVETEFSVIRFRGDTDRADAVYEGVDPLTGEDIAEIAVWIADRPAHVQIAEVIVFARMQATATMVHRQS